MICYKKLSFLKNSFHLSFSIQDSLGKNSTQLLRHCVRLLVLVSTDLVAVRLSGMQFSSLCFIRFKPLHIINFFSHYFNIKVLLPIFCLSAFEVC